MATPTSISAYWLQLRKPLELELARGCPDTAIVGRSIGEYTRLWAERLRDAREEDTRLALSLARGLRDYATMPVSERRRRVVAAIDLLRHQEEGQHAPLPKKAPAPRKPAPAATPRRKAVKEDATPLPTGAELLDTALEELAPRANWPKSLASKLGIYTARDLLYHIPRDWVEIQPIADLLDGARAAIVGTVVRRESSTLKAKQFPHPLSKYILTVQDDSGEAWISSITVEQKQQRGKRAPWSPSRLQFTPGQRVFALGKVDRTGKLVDLHMEDIFQLSAAEETELRPGGRVPLYPLTSGVYQNQVHRMVLRLLAALDAGDAAEALTDPLPADVREQYALQPLAQALSELHHPRDDAQHEQARKRLAFEEFLTPQLILARRRWAHHHDKHAPVLTAPEHIPELVGKLVPFSPTLAQLRVMGEIEEDLRRPRVMNRLLQGDVGSGKTLVAAGALAFAARSGFQATIMAPTEILAEQLYLVLSHLLGPLRIKPVLLTGSVTGAERRSVLAELAEGTAPIAVGTHALIQEGVTFAKLGLVIIDEQHRFGVLQRATLRGKGKTPNLLVMTATPIPRTLTLTLYGDLDVSRIDQPPPGRGEIVTKWIKEAERAKVYKTISEEAAKGHAAYVVLPRIEEAEDDQGPEEEKGRKGEGETTAGRAAAQSAIRNPQSAIPDAVKGVEKELLRLRKALPKLRIEMLHGRLSSAEKDRVLTLLREGNLDVLVSTQVIEVGIDLPKATVMLIENAEMFGLSALHQLRGRVGRSERASYCFLAGRATTDEATERLETMVKTRDGFEIAEVDFKLRGPGQFFGTQQSGMPELKIADLLRDARILAEARDEAFALVRDDPTLSKPEHAALRERIRQVLGPRLGLIDVG
ncbi:MAG TPA: ATP-dependent DNA helicase RecG [Planctomycetota bacterium]